MRIRMKARLSHPNGGKADRNGHRLGCTTGPPVDDQRADRLDLKQPGTPLNFAGVVRHAPSQRARRGQKLIMGPWGHRVNESRRLGEVDFGPEAVIDLDGYEVRWLDYWLKGMDNGIGDEPPE